MQTKVNVRLDYVHIDILIQIQYHQINVKQNGCHNCIKIFNFTS